MIKQYYKVFNMPPCKYQLNSIQTKIGKDLDIQILGIDKLS